MKPIRLHPDWVHTTDGGDCWCKPHIEPVYVNPDDPDDGRVDHMVVIHNDNVGLVLGTRPLHYRFEKETEAN